jgi:Cache domain
LDGTSYHPSRRVRRAIFGRAHPTNKGKNLSEIEGKHGAPFGQEIMQSAAEGTIKTVTYWWPRRGSDKPLEKTTFYTKTTLSVRRLP